MKHIAILSSPLLTLAFAVALSGVADAQSVGEFAPASLLDEGPGEGMDMTDYMGGYADFDGTALDSAAYNFEASYDVSSTYRFGGPARTADLAEMDMFTRSSSRTDRLATSDDGSDQEDGAIEGSLEGDWRALMALYNSTGGADWRNSENWAVSDTPPTAEELNTWYGVTVSNGRATELELFNNGLSGSIPSELGDLSALVTLDLRFNALTGSIPAELGRLSNLYSLFLRSNSLTGSIPSELGRLSRLKRLSLNVNKLTGPIPRKLGDMSSLQELDLRFNDLSGLVPVELSNLSSLTTLYLNGNELIGSLPVSLTRLSRLSRFNWESQTAGTGETTLCAPSAQSFQSWLTGVASRSGPNCETLPASLMEDWRALVALYTATNGDHWVNNFNWSDSDTPPTAEELGTWWGVNVSDGRVTSLFLYNNGLAGSIPAELGNLSSLQWLGLSSNSLTGPIPPELGGLSRLTSLELYGNGLVGQIPAALGNMGSLEYLGLDENQLSGPIPPELGNLSSLVQLGLGFNSLSGSIPAEMGRLSSLQYLSLYSNSLSGPIPAELGDLSSLVGLNLELNALTGPVPSELGKLSNLDSLTFERNALTGSLPASLTNLANLSYLSWQKQTAATGETALCSPTDEAFKNWLSGVAQTFGADCGTLPTSSAPAGSLQEDWEALVALYNATGGPNWANDHNWSDSDTPPTAEELSSWYGVTVINGRVARLSLDENALTGSLPTELGQLHGLNFLWLGRNALTGELPASLTNLSSLDGLFWRDQVVMAGEELLCASRDEAFQTWLESVEVTGGPKCGPIAGLLLEDWRALVALYNATDGANWRNNDNWSDSETPPTEAELESWFGVSLANDRVISLLLLENGLSGSLPAELENLTGLTRLLLIGNGVTGSLPPELGNLTSLQILHLANNALEGPIPAELGNLSGLTRLDLTRNNLTGPIPPELGELSSLTTLRLAWNSLNGPIPVELTNLTALARLWLGPNDLTGSVPAGLGDMINLRSLYLFGNNLTGSIPRELGNLSRLQTLNLSNNSLTGPIPVELSNLSNLQSLSLGGNPLTGSIPAELGNLSKLRSLSIFGTTLTGSIPPELGNLSSLGHLSLSGNLGLTGSIPAEFGNLSNLRQIWLHRNALTGPLPASLTNIPTPEHFWWTDQRVAEGESVLCAPTDEAFQNWLAGIGNTNGPNCENGESNEADASAPRIEEVSLISTPGSDAVYGAGEVVEVAVRFSEQVTVTGEPRLLLDLGAANVAAELVSSGASTVQSFRYEVTLGDFDIDGVSVGQESLQLNGGAIRSSDGTAAATGLGVHTIENAPEHIVDARSLAAERAVVADALAAQGRAQLASVTDVIGERFRTGWSERGTGFVGDFANTLRGLDSSQARAAHAGSLERHAGSGLACGTSSAGGNAWSTRGSTRSTGAGACSHTALFAAPDMTLQGPRSSVSPGMPWGRKFSLPLGGGSNSVAGSGWTLWGANDVQTYSGESSAGGFDGDLQSLYLGIDGRLTRDWMAGAAVSRSRGAADYEFSAGDAGGEGQLRTGLTSIYPYLQGRLSEGLEAWAIGGFGTGDAELDRHERGDLQTGGLTMGLGAVGISRDLLTLGSMNLSLLADAGAVRLWTDSDASVLGGLTSTVHRTRLGVEGEHAFSLGVHGSLRPFWQVNARYDGGDGHTGGGVELAAGLRYGSDRFEAQVQARWLAVQSGEAYEEFGGSASLEFKPRQDGLGLAASVSQSWGAADTGSQSMWREQAMWAAYGVDGRRRPADHETWSTDGRIGYALALPGTAGLLTPFGEFRLAGESSVRQRAGVRLDRSDLRGSRLGVELGVGVVERPLQRAAGAVDISVDARF